MTAVLLLLLAWSPNGAEPAPIPIPGFGPVLDRAAADAVGLFPEDDRFASLRFVQPDSQGNIALVGTWQRQTVVETPVVLDPDEAELVLSSLAPGMKLRRAGRDAILAFGLDADVSCLGPATRRRSVTGALSFGTVGFGLGVAAGTKAAFNPDNRESGWPVWRKANLAKTLLLSAATALPAGLLGWHIGSRYDAGRPYRPRPRCAVAAFDYSGRPIYEEQVADAIGLENTLGAVLIGSAAGAGLAALAAGATSSLLFRVDQWNDPNGLGDGFAEVSLVPGVMATSLFFSSTIGRDLDRKATIEAIRRQRLSAGEAESLPVPAADGKPVVQRMRGAAPSPWKRLVFKGQLAEMRGGYTFAASGQPDRHGRYPGPGWSYGAHLLSLGIGYRVRPGWALAVETRGYDVFSWPADATSGGLYPVYVHLLRFQKLKGLDSRSASVFVGLYNWSYSPASYLTAGVCAQTVFWGFSPGVELRWMMSPVDDRTTHRVSISVSAAIGGWYFP